MIQFEEKMDMIQQKHCLQKIKWYECDTLENKLQLHVAREIFNSMLGSLGDVLIESSL